MSKKYGPVRANDMYIDTPGEIRVTEESQIDRVERKVDRILHILENGELSTHVDDETCSKSLITNFISDKSVKASKI